ncbi:MAG: CsgG/HfaB family protein [Candidatus Edwardsbacteria bacterium]|nr:CsgG/HfaB family protein [Candidatus Edwardsbacteria bacterium]
MKSFEVIILACLLAAMAAGSASAGGKPWDYYENGQKLMEQGKWDQAVDEFRAAISLEFKDKKNLRTYGMNYIDYFPHREMAICYYNLGDMALARRELDLSLAYSSSSRAKEYLSKVGSGVAPAAPFASGQSREEDERLNRERERLEQQKKQLADELAALEAQKKAQSAAEQKALQEQKDKLAKLEAEKAALEKERAGQNKLPIGALTYDPSRVTQVGSRLSIAVMPFENKGGDPGLSTMVQDKMITSLYSLKRFKIIERSQIEKVMSEQKLGMTGAIDQSKAVKVGKLIGVDAILIGSVSSGDKGTGMDARLIDTENGTIITAKDALSDRNTLMDIKNMAQNIAIQIYNDVPLVEGYLIKLDGAKCILDVGAAKGMRKGMKMVVYKEGDAITHPVTGDILGKQVTKLGELLLTEVQDRMSEADLIEKEPGQSISMGNKVVAK